MVQPKNELVGRSHKSIINYKKMKLNTIFKSTLLLVGLAAVVSCKQEVKKEAVKEISENIIVIEAENFYESSAEMVKETIGEQTFVSAASEGWIAVEVPVKIAGRYTTSLVVASEGESTLWVEDYIDNTDERTYNITSNIVSNSSEFQTISKDGTPMNATNRKMKIHFNGPVKIDQLKFELMKKHDVTPNFMTQSTTGKEWKVVWSDEFEGTEVDTTKWTYDIGDWGWGNYELQYYTANRKENARVEDGALIIEARKNDMGSPWTSARLTTRGKTAFTYGRMEIMAKVPKEKGNWAAGWTLGDSYVDELSWPYCGELDIMESVGYEMDDETESGIAHASVHCEAYYFKLGNQKTYVVPVEKMESEFHSYMIEWTPEYIKAFVDGNEYFHYDNSGEPGTWPFDEPQNLIINLAMGGGWGGAQGMHEEVTSQKMIIDYVRVYELQ